MSTATKSKPQSHSHSAGKKSSVKLQPLGDRVVVEREESEGRTAGGIVLPDTAKDKPARGTVISVGDGRLLDDGTRHPLQVKPGDRVIFSSYAGEQFKIGERRAAPDARGRHPRRHRITPPQTIVPGSRQPAADSDRPQPSVPRRQNN